MIGKKAISLVVVLLSVIASVLIIRGGSEDADKAGFMFEEGTNSNFLFESGSDSASLNAETNITETVARLYGEELLKLNEPGAFKNGSPIAVPNENVLDELIEEELSKKIAISLFRPNDVIITDDESNEAIVFYFNELASKYRKIFGQNDGNFFLAIAEIVANGNPEPLEQQLEMTRDYLDGILTIRVPQGLRDFHLQMLNLWQKRLTLGNVVLKTEDDPLKTVVAVNELLALLDDEEKIFSEFEKISQ